MDRCLKFVWPLHCPRTLRMRMCYANKLPKVTTPCPPPLFHLHVKKVRTLRACCAIVGPTQLIKARPFKLSLNIYSGTGPWSGPLITPVLGEGEAGQMRGGRARQLKHFLIGDQFKHTMLPTPDCSLWILEREQGRGEHSYRLIT